MKRFLFALACVTLMCACQEESIMPDVPSPEVPHYSDRQYKVVMIMDDDTISVSTDTLMTRASKEVNNATVYGVGTYSHGDNVTVSAYPKTGYYIEEFKVIQGSATTCTFSYTSAKGTITSIAEDVTFKITTKPSPVIIERAYNGYFTSSDANHVHSQERATYVNSPGDTESGSPNSMSGVFAWRYVEARAYDGTSNYSNTAGPSLKTSFPGISTTFTTSTNRGYTSTGTEGKIKAEKSDVLVVYSFYEIGDATNNTWPAGTTVPFLLESANSSAITDKWYETSYELTYYSPTAAKQCRFVNAVISDFIVYQSASSLAYNSSTGKYEVKDITDSGTSYTTDYSEHYLYEDMKAGKSINLKLMKLRLIDLRKRSQINSKNYSTSTKQADLEIDFSGLNWSSTYKCWYVSKQIPGTSNYVMVYVMQGSGRKTMREMFSGKTSSSLSTWSKSSGNQLYIAIKYTTAITDTNPVSNVIWQN